MLVLWMVLGITMAPSTTARPDEEGPEFNVTAVMEGEAFLPCNVSTVEEDDQPGLILFYNSNSGTPIYTVDFRGKRKSQATHLPMSVLKDRAEFQLRPGKSGLHLRRVWSSDDGLYRCRVDFKKSPTRYSKIYLTVIVPPDSVRIVDRNGNQKSSTIGPYVLGQTLGLKCVATGGRPAPKLTWWAGHTEIRGQIVESGNEVVNTLTIPSLQRHHLHQSFICQASNADEGVPITAAVTVDMTLPPMTIKLRGVENPISAGVGVTAVCMVVGARPHPNVTWWLDGKPLRATNERTLDNGNVTESHVVVVARAKDHDRYLSCRAETPGLLHSRLDDGAKLSVHYVPEVKMTLGPRLALGNIREGDDVYFTCTVEAKPPPISVQWYHNEVHLKANNTGGVIVGNMTLALQNVGRFSSGAYTCRATNSEGKGSSRPIALDVKYKPVCRPGQRWQYGIARHEMVHVTCDVDAHPRLVTFQWSFNNSAEMTDIAEAHITNNFTRSTLTYSPITKMDYGYLLCRARNEVGKQSEPCVYTIFPAGPPDALKNCTVLNESLDAVQVRCEEGFDGGLPQKFIMEVYETEGRKFKSNVTSNAPSFTVRGLPSGLALTIRVYAVNDKGHSKPSVLPAVTLPDTAEKHIAGVIPASELPSTMELSPSLTVIMGVVGGILVVFVVIVVVMVVRRPRRDNLQARLHQDDSSLHILKKDDSHSGRLDVDEKDPDVIPESRGARAELVDRHGVSDVSTLYGEIVGVGGVVSVAAEPPTCAAHPHTHPAVEALPSPPPQPAHSNYVEQNTHATNAHVEPVHVHTESQPHAHHHHHHHHHAQYMQQEYTPPPPLPTHVEMHHSAPYHHMQAPSPAAVVPTYSHAHAMPVSHTQTLPHPRSNAARAHHAHATLQRRSSLYMDPMMTPLAPPPAYGSPTTSLAPDMMVVVPIVAETVCITPNAPLHGHAHANPPDQYPAQPFPTSFSSDRMESAV